MVTRCARAPWRLPPVAAVAKLRHKLRDDARKPRYVIGVVASVTARPSPTHREDGCKGVDVQKPGLDGTELSYWPARDRSREAAE